MIALSGGLIAGIEANGISRNEDCNNNCWESDGISANGETLTFDLEKATVVSQVRITFNSNFNYSIKQTMSVKRQEQQRIGIPPELVRDYSVEFLLDGKTVETKEIKENHQRLNVIDLNSVLCDKINIIMYNTNGYESVSVFEVRIY